MTNERPETRILLLDTAERLFAEHGYDGTSLRLIAAEAGTNLGAVNYHFLTKQALYAETFIRRFRPVNAERARQLTLARAEADDAPIPVERLLDCLLRPAFDTTRQHPLFAKLLARNLITPPAFFQEIIEEDMTFILRAFGPEFRRSAPDLPPQRALLRLHLCAGALLFMATAPEPPPAAGPPPPPEIAYRELLTFTTAGFLAGRKNPPL